MKKCKSYEGVIVTVIDLLLLISSEEAEFSFDFILLSLYNYLLDSSMSWLLILSFLYLD